MRYVCVCAGAKHSTRAYMINIQNADKFRVEVGFCHISGDSIPSIHTCAVLTRAILRTRFYNGARENFLHILLARKFLTIDCISDRSFPGDLKHPRHAHTFHCSFYYNLLSGTRSAELVDFSSPVYYLYVQIIIS